MKIYTLTVNPAIDYIISLESFAEGEINRTKTEKIYAGGKGINVSTVLKNLGHESSALGFVAGPTGKMLEGMLISQGVKNDFVHISEGNTRINVKLHASVETEINGNGPRINARDVRELYEKLDGLADGDFLVMSGNVPECLQEDNYQLICESLAVDGLELEGGSFYGDMMLYK